MSCTCQSCKKEFKVDLEIEDALWAKMQHTGEKQEDGKLCGSCIFKQIEKLNLNLAFNLSLERGGVKKPLY